MKVSTKWLNNYVTINDINPKRLGDMIERTSVEVSSVLRLKDNQSKIVVGHILECYSHPNSDHLKICKVDIGNHSINQIICGAPNVKKGQNVIVALPNARIAGHIKIKKGKIRGEISEGMICSLQEIGFSDKVVPKSSIDGIYVLPSDVIIGDSVFNYLGMDEYILDLSVTPNRGDLLSMIGVAREVAAIYDRRVTINIPKIPKNFKFKIDNYINIKDSSKKLVKSYKVKIVRNVHVKSSPLWLQKRLWNAGIRPINNIIDIVNYVLIEYGQPLRCYDYDKLNSQNLCIRSAKKNETFIADGISYKLSTDDIVVSSDDNIISLAGIIGSDSTKVNSETKNILLENAAFNPVMVRKTARNKNIHSESSQRIERGIDLEAIQTALDRAVELIIELGNGEIVDGTSSINVERKNKVSIAITTEKINNILGTNLAEDYIVGIFNRLGFKVSKDILGVLNVIIPSYRNDIRIEADLVEEVARIYGYDNLPVTLPKTSLTLGRYNKKQSFIYSSCNLLESSGLTQAISYSLTTKDKAQRFVFENVGNPILLQRPMSHDRTTLRMNLISGLLDDIRYNLSHGIDDVSLYEQGRIFIHDKENNHLCDVEHIAGALTGSFGISTWNNRKESVDFYLVKGIVNFLLSSLGIRKNIFYHSISNCNDLHPGRSASIYVNNEIIGVIGQVHPSLEKALKISQTYVFELNLDKLLCLPKYKEIYSPISKYPEVVRDISLLVPINISNDVVVKNIIKYGGKFLSNVKLFDLYEGKNIRDGFKSLAYKLTYSNTNNSLKDDDVNDLVNKLVVKLNDKFDISIR